MNDIRNIDRFKKGKGKYREIFLGLLKKISMCCRLLAAENSVIENNENKIRNRLLKAYLNNNSVKEKLNIKYFIFTAETAEIDDDYKAAGYTDIRISLPLTFSKPDAYYILECKRLDGNKTLNRKYIQEGLMRFISNRYPTYFGFNGMIGFLVKPVHIGENIDRINKLCGQEFPQTGTTPVITMEREPDCYKSAHINQITKKEITLYHLMVDFSDVIKG